MSSDSRSTSPTTVSSSTRESPPKDTAASPSSHSDFTQTSPFETTAAAHRQFQIVVAHYKEDLSWLEPARDDCVVYSKGGLSAPPGFLQVNLSNIGREGHTYLYHIVEHYDSLADVTLFTQGRVDDHISLSAIEMKEKALRTPPYEVMTFPFRELELFDHWGGIPWELYPSWAKWSSMPRVKARHSPAHYFSVLLSHDKVPLSIGFQPGAIFAVKRETIHQHSRCFYHKMLQEFFLGEMAHVNPETGHLMERFWLAMWRPEEYCCWEESEISVTERNSQGQLAKGRWHRTPHGVAVDEALFKVPEDHQ
ncbi:hypothetical protein MMC28_009461 [Mycoblastus sanguinarius]|nr:hypothetical protein [Mycoblastus sanguinarius]